MVKPKLGTCSWKYDSWEGIVYSQKKPANYLAQYGTHFNTVEIDQWFWSLFGIDKVSLPKANVVREYAASVPPEFSFTVKIPNSITLTHFYTKGRNAPLVENPHFFSISLFLQFLECLEPMKKQIGVLMFQFEYLNRNKMPNKKVFLDRFAAFLEKCPPDYKYGVEIRNPNYLDASYFEFLNRHNLCHVFVQGYYMPMITVIYKDFSRYINDTVVIRLMGPDRSDIEKKSGNEWNRRLEPKDGELGDIVKMIRHLLERGIKVFVNVNNHYEGSAPLTIRYLQERLGL